MSEAAIIRLLASDPMTTRQLQLRLSATVAKPHTAQIVMNLNAKRKVALTRGNKWQLTALGYAMLPTTAPKRNWGTYTPPVRIRREGSEVAGKLPSLFAGRRIDRETH